MKTLRLLTRLVPQHVHSSVGKQSHVLIVKAHLGNTEAPHIEYHLHLTVSESCVLRRPGDPMGSMVGSGEACPAPPAGQDAATSRPPGPLADGGAGRSGVTGLFEGRAA
uniref:Uncharacterized protein n=1 Tax=Rangifer tarandus platyrhynchus TaxID=3082113 RepID=A0ACB0E6D4_RANTA|nr:unnamed protein product [Rangifer tarandus platyrhynchus]